MQTKLYTEVEHQTKEIETKYRKCKWTTGKEHWKRFTRTIYICDFAIEQIVSVIWKKSDFKNASANG